MTEADQDTLSEALKRHQIDLPDDQFARLDEYCRLLWEWNTKINLTRHTNYEKFVTRDLVDSLQVAALLKEGEAVLDVGSGGGVPGIVLAIVRPDLDLALCESVGKKAQALNEMVSQLNLKASVFHGRVEVLLDDFFYQTLVARAVGSLTKLCRWLSPHWSVIGRLLAVKGPSWIEERNEARHLGVMQNLELRRVATYEMPGTESESVILQVWPKGKKPE